MNGAKPARVGFLNLARLGVALLLGLCQAALAQTEQHIPLLLSASDETREGFVRIINRSSSAGSVAVVAIDDSGREFGPVRVTVDGGNAINFSSRDLESGNAAKGVARGIAWAGGRFYVVDGLDKKVYAYSGAGERDVSADFDLHEDNFWPTGIVRSDGRFYVVDLGQKVYSYVGSDAPEDGEGQANR